MLVDVVAVVGAVAVAVAVLVVVVVVVVVVVAVAVVVVFCLAFCRGYTGSKFTVPMISCDVLDYDPVCEAGPRSMIDAKMLQELPKKKLGLFDN